MSNTMNGESVKRCAPGCCPDHRSNSNECKCGDAHGASCYGGARPKVKSDPPMQVTAEEENCDSLSKPSTSGLSSTMKTKRTNRPPLLGDYQENQATNNKTLPTEPASDSDSAEEDEYIYTYKGNSADLPLSNQGHTSSPEMDFLEMDFDPEQSNGPSSNSSQMGDGSVKSGDCFSGRSEIDLSSDSWDNGAVPIDGSDQEAQFYIQPEISEVNMETVQTPKNSPTQGTSSIGSSGPIRHEPSSQTFMDADPEESYYRLAVAAELRSLTFNQAKIGDIESTAMVWSVREAKTNQAPEIGSLGCGKSAIMNALKALGYRTDNPPLALTKEDQVKTNTTHSELVDFLLQTSTTGATASSIIETVSELSEGRIGGKFFATYPPRDTHITSWLLYWINKGAVPILCLNFQRDSVRCDGLEYTLTRSWGYKMVHGIGPSGVYLCSSMECVPLPALMQYLLSPSEIMIAKTEILSRWTPETDLSPLAEIDDRNWRRYNVLGQLAHLVREYKIYRSYENLKHVMVPCIFKAGMILLMPKDNANFDDLINCPEFLIKDEYCAQKRNTSENSDAPAPVHSRTLDANDS